MVSTIVSDTPTSKNASLFSFDRSVSVEIQIKPTLANVSFALCKFNTKLISSAAPSLTILAFTLSLPANARSSFSASRVNRIESLCSLCKRPYKCYMNDGMIVPLGELQQNITIAFKRNFKPPASSTTTQNS